ncbi:MAG: TadE/TadG family type IV pilus assembly protein [Rhodospirillaceae bacterium]
MTERRGLLARLRPPKLHGGWFARLSREEKGLAAVEMAFVIPVLVFLLLGGIEMGRLILINQKADRAAATLADLISQSEAVSETSIQDIFEAATWVLEPYPADPNAAMILTSVIGNGGARIAWQRARNTSPGESRVGQSGGAASLPPGFVVRDGENVVIAELFYDYEPLFLPDLVGSRVLSKSSYFRPRFAILDTVLR